MKGSKRLGVWSGDRPGASPRSYGLRRHVPEHVVDNTDFGLMWRVLEDKMEVAAERTWTKSERGSRALHLRERVPREFWECSSHSTIMQMYSQKPFFSNAMTGDGQDPRMDKRREMGGFKICGMYLDLHQNYIDSRTEKVEYF